MILGLLMTRRMMATEGKNTTMVVAAMMPCATWTFSRKASSPCGCGPRKRSTSGIVGEAGDVLEVDVADLVRCVAAERNFVRERGERESVVKAGSWAWK
jgi:hypothetical protein